MRAIRHPRRLVTQKQPKLITRLFRAAAGVATAATLGCLAAYGASEMVATSTMLGGYAKPSLLHMGMTFASGIGAMAAANYVTKQFGNASRRPAQTKGGFGAYLKKVL